MEEKVFESWLVKEQLGEGSFGKVYRIEREDFGVKYEAALKKIVVPQSPKEISEAVSEGMDEESVTRYFRTFVEEIVSEFQLMSKLKGHSNIVSYEDHKVIAHEDGIGWDILIRMELLTSLADAIADKPLNEREIIKLGRDICQALEICRKYNIIHRDIKPENIFVSALGDYKLGDFGIARTAEKTMSNLSKKGTYNYMAPEVYKGEAYGASVDIYSLGIVMYRFLNNNRMPFLPPFPEPISYSNRESAITKRMAGEAIAAPCDGSEELKRIVLKACAYRPEDRYASPEEMRAELEKLAEAARQGTTEEPFLPADDTDEDKIISSVPAWKETVIEEDIMVGSMPAPDETAMEEDKTVGSMPTPDETVMEEDETASSMPTPDETVIEEDRTVSIFQGIPVERKVRTLQDAAVKEEKREGFPKEFPEEAQKTTSLPQDYLEDGEKTVSIFQVIPEERKEEAFAAKAMDHKRGEAEAQVPVKLPKSDNPIGKLVTSYVLIASGFIWAAVILGFIDSFGNYYLNFQYSFRNAYDYYIHVKPVSFAVAASSLVAALISGIMVFLMHIKGERLPAASQMRVFTVGLVADTILLIMAARDAYDELGSISMSIDGIVYIPSGMPYAIYILILVVIAAALITGIVKTNRETHRMKS